MGGFARHSAFRILHSALYLLPWFPGFHHKPSEYNPHPPPPSGWSGGTLDKPWTCPGTREPPQTRLFNQPHLSSPLHPPLFRLRSARADGRPPAALRCSPRVYPRWITKSPLFAGHSHYFLHPVHLALPSLPGLMLDVGCWMFAPHWTLDSKLPYPPRTAHNWNRDNQPHPEVWKPRNQWEVQN